jgi:hypothetical protein
MTESDQHGEIPQLGGPEPALMYGRLVDVDSEACTAVLSIYRDCRVPLRLGAARVGEALNLQQKFVKVTGQGWLDENDQWIAVVVDEISPPDPQRSVDEILNDPNPKIFDPDKVIRASEPFDVDEFLRAIYEGRGRTWNG